MKRLARALLVSAVLLIAHDARADLAWNECVTGGGITNRNFACDTNTGEDILVGSFTVPWPMSQSFGYFGLEMQTAGATLPSWWSVASAGACRPLGLTFAPCVSGACEPGFTCDATRSLSFTPGFRAPNRALIQVFVNMTSERSYSTGVSYEGFRLSLSHDKSTGAGSCAGCSQAACIVFDWMYIPGVGDPYIKVGPGGTQNYVTWQGGAIAAPGCPAATPARNATWGAIKTLYR